MNRQTQNDQVLSVLTRRQYTHPHAPLKQELAETVEEIGCCPVAVDAAMSWLAVDPNQPIGSIGTME